MKWRKLVSWAAGPLVAMSLALALPGVGAAEEVTVSVDAPPQVAEGSYFVVEVRVTEVTDFDACQFDLNYDPGVIQVNGPEGGPTGVTAGLIGSTAVPIDKWGYLAPGIPGRIRVLGNLPGASGVTGSGTLAEIHFHVVGAGGSSTGLNLSNVLLFNKDAQPISPVTAVSDSVYILVEYRLSIASTSGGDVVAPGEGLFTFPGGMAVNLRAAAYPGWRFVQWTGDVATIDNVFSAQTYIVMDGEYSIRADFFMVGDADGDEDVDVRDVTAVERVILGLDQMTLRADATGDGLVDVRDVTRIEAIALGYAY